MQTDEREVISFESAKRELEKQKKFEKIRIKSINI